MTRFDSARSNEIETPALNLKPEEYLTTEIGIKGRNLGSKIELAGYYTEITNMIVRTPTGAQIDSEWEVTKKNTGDGYVVGAEMRGSYKFFATLQVRGSSAIQYGEVATWPTSDPISVIEPLDRLAPFAGHLDLRWQTPGGSWWLLAEMNAAAAARRLSTRDRSDSQRIPVNGTPGYAIYNLRAGYSPLPMLDTYLALENLLDRDYRIHGSGVNETGFNVVGGLEIRL